MLKIPKSFPNFFQSYPHEPPNAQEVKQGFSLQQ